MKHLHTFESFLNEASSKNILSKLIPGVKFMNQEIEFDSEEGYKSVESFSVTVPGLGGNYGEDELYLNIYNGNTFCFFYDAAPIPTSLHSKSQANIMSQTQSEVPLPIDKLNKKIFDEVVNSIKEQITD